MTIHFEALLVKSKPQLLLSKLDSSVSPQALAKTQLYI